MLSFLKNQRRRAIRVEIKNYIRTIQTKKREILKFELEYLSFFIHFNTKVLKYNQ